MKKLVHATLIASLSIVGSAWADDGAAIAKKAGCTAACHSVDKKTMGPTFKDVATKYAGDKGAQAKLEKKVRSGGSGSFGAMAMPPTGKSVSDADIKAIVGWVLGLK